MNCLYCSAPLLEVTYICPNCGRKQAGSSTGAITLDEGLHGSTLGVGEFLAATRLIIAVRDVRFLVSIPARIIIGRVDYNTTPGIDLSAYAAFLNGVSRSHAEFRREGDTELYIADLNSKNGTFVNGVRVMPDHPVQVHDGDTLRLGNLLFNVYFK